MLFGDVVSECVVVVVAVVVAEVSQEDAKQKVSCLFALELSPKLQPGLVILSRLNPSQSLVLRWLLLFVCFQSNIN